MKRVIVGGLCLVALLAGSLVGVPSSAAAVRPIGEIRVDDRGYEGQFDVFTGSVQLRCRTGLTVTSVHLSFTQSGVTSPEVSASPVPCDGTWRRQSYTSFPGNYSGPAQVHARVVLVDTATGAARGEVTSTRDVYVRPGAKVVLPATVQLRPTGVLRFQVQGRCDVPWVLQDFGVSASQFQGFAFASARVDIPCDGAFHTRALELRSSGRQFAHGWVTLQGSISTLDGVHFDPAVGATASRGARVL